MRKVTIGFRIFFIVGSIVLAAFSGWKVFSSNGGRFLVELSQSEIQKGLVKISLREVDHIALEQALRSELEVEPLNWVVIDSIESIGDSMSIAFTEETQSYLDTARATDHSFLHTAAECARCAWDSSSCQLSKAMVCGTVVSMTPIGDVAGIASAGADYWNGNEIDKLDAALSMIGLGATAMSFGTAGSSLTVKAGAGFLKFAYQTGNIPPSIARVLRKAASEGIDWAQLRSVRSLEDIKSIMRMDVLSPATNAVSSLSGLVTTAGVQQSLYLLSNSKNIAELQTLSRVSVVWKDETAGFLRVIGKNRIIRNSLKVAGGVYGLGVAVILFVISIFWTMISLVVGRFFRRARLFI